MDDKCAWRAFSMLIGHFLPQSIHPSSLWIVSAGFPKPPLPPNLHVLHFPPILFHHWNLSGINVIPNPPCLHSTSCSLQSGQFPFCQSRHQWLRSCLFRYIRIGNLILCQSFLSSPHRQTFHICMQTEAGWLHLSRDAWACAGEHAAAQSF